MCVLRYLFDLMLASPRRRIRHLQRTVDTLERELAKIRADVEHLYDR